MEHGDVIIIMSGKEITDIEDYMNILQQLVPGEEVALSVKRGAKILKFTLQCKVHKGELSI